MVQSFSSRSIRLKQVGSVLIGSFLATIIATPADRATAQIIPDGTLPTPTLVTGNSEFTITGGTQADSNLFHSFREFSVPTGGSAFFNNALDVKNIFSRVTGSSISTIDGVIRANGTANLFLLNPNGIIFGSNASLNIGGSFLGSTASSINFADGIQFSATNPQAQPLLTVSVPVGLGFGSNLGAIRVQGTGHTLRLADAVFTPYSRGNSSTGLRVQPGNTLALVGGDVALEGGTLTAEGGRIELGSVAAGGVVSLSPTPVGWTLGYQGVQSFQEIRLSQRALVDASGVSGGSIHMQGRRIELRDGSVVLIQNQGSQPAGSISVNASESLELSGTSPDVNITSTLASQTVGVGNAGNIEISTPRLVVRDGGGIRNRTFTAARGGDVSVNASESVQLIGASSLNPTLVSEITSRTLGSGNAGNITVLTRRLDILNGASIGSSSTTTGSTGDVSIDASESVQVIGIDPSIFLAQSNVSSLAFNQGNAGKVTINTARLVIRDGGAVTSSTLAGGSAGSLTINASKSVEVSGTVAGSINPTGIASSATILDELTRRALGLPDMPSGDSGDVTINTPVLSVTDGALVNVRNDGTGKAGMLTVNAPSIFLDKRGSITASTASGEGGEIVLRTQNLQLRNNSAITATAGGTSQGGNIIINTDTLVALENSDITANAPQGAGGRITINAQGIFGTQAREQQTSESDITAFGKNPELNGIVQVNTPDIDLQSALNQVEANFVSTEQAIANSCLARRNVERGSFTVTGTGGLPQNPYEAISGRYAVTQVQGLPAEARQQASSPSLPPPHSPTSWKLGDPIQEAQGMTVTADGRIIVGTASQLVAAAQPQDLICGSSTQSSASQVISP